MRKRPNVGDVIRYRYKGEYEYATYLGRGSMRILNPSRIPIGTTIHSCIWKKDLPYVLSSRTVKSQLPTYTNSMPSKFDNKPYTEEELKP